MPASGPAIPVLSSTTRIPSNGPNAYASPEFGPSYLNQLRWSPVMESPAIRRPNATREEAPQLLDLQPSNGSHRPLRLASEIFDLDQLDGFAARTFDHRGAHLTELVGLGEEGDALVAQLGDPGVEIGDAERDVVVELAARAHQRLIALPHVPGEGHVTEADRGRRLAVHPVRLERREAKLGDAGDPAGGLGQRRGAGAPAKDRRVEVPLVPELGAEGVLLEEVHVVEALGRMIAGVFHQRPVRTFHVGEAAREGRLDAPGLGLGDLCFGPPKHTAGARPGIAADEDRPIAFPGIERYQPDL